MNIPFMRFLKKEKAGASSAAVAPPPSSALEKPASERLGKTVMPNSSRIVGLEPVGNFPIPAPASSPAQRATPAPSRKISLGGHGSIAVAPKVPATTPPVERTIALSLADLLPHIPSELLKPVPIDPERRVILQAAEVERGMASGRPTVLLRGIYKQAPEFFAVEVPAADLREVPLPFTKVVEQFANFQVRDDQITDQECPQLETPFLQVTLEDGERFGKPLTPPAVRETPAVQPAVVAEQKPAVVAAAKPAVAEPPPAALPAALAPAATDAAPKRIAPIRFSPPPASAGEPALAPTPVPTPTPTPALKAPLSLDQVPPSPPTTAKISPNGTGAPAAERVPASSGSPVPTPLPSPLAAVAPARIPFKVSPPSNDLRKESKFPSPQAKHDSPEFTTSGPRISLPLRNILRNVSPFQLTGPIDSVPETALIEIPFSIVQPQLSLGRVAISPAQFQAALPEEHRALFKGDDAGTLVPLPLQDVLQNLPGESLQLRGDQEEPEITEAFETPFSQKASEDAARMKVPAGPIAKKVAAASELTPTPLVPPVEPALPPAVATAKIAPQPLPDSAAPLSQAAVTMPKTAAPEPPKETPKPEPALTGAATKPAAKASVAAVPMRRNALQNALDTDEPLDAKSVVAHVSRQPGVSACAVAFSDGLSLAGNIPAEFEADALSAMAPSIIKRIDEQMVGAKFGALKSLTLYCGNTPVSLFAHGNICLVAIHSSGEIAAEVRDRLVRTTQELARMYAQAA